MRHLLSIEELEKKDILDIINLAIKIKKKSKHYSKLMYEKSLLMIFELPSLRTRISFETAMTQMGGHAINYYTIHSPWGVGKESIEDVGNVVSRYVNAVMTRIKDHNEIVKLAQNSQVPIINGLSNKEHPCQILGDLLTIYEKGKLKNLKLAYLGDANNNVTYSLMHACSKMGIQMSIACPQTEEFLPSEDVIRKTKTKVFKNPGDATRNADVVYTDSWMSYSIPKKEKIRRTKALKRYQVTKDLMGITKKDSIFMHCLPALREHEVTKDVIDGSKSVVFDQAENRMHIQKAIITWCLGKL
ncbi:ornithine carbamoyltransferase [archaeon]|nr:ornithine carbamoyltransferase [archaeon]